MSGSFISSGIPTNNKKKPPEIEKIMDLKIKSLSIHILPLIINNQLNILRIVGQFFQQFIHPKIFSPTLSHIAIQLNMENDKDYIIMEYGQYLTEYSEITNNSIFSSFDYNLNSKEVEKNNNIYWYMNKDGLRITKINNKCLDYFIKKYSINLNIISQIIAANHYGMKVDEFREKNSNLLFGKLFECIQCNIENKITLRELYNYFTGENWKAKNYSVFSKNCQYFAAEIIRILKAVRIDDYYKIRSIEKIHLPNCVISALWENEKLSFTNTMGRIPFLGLFYDLYKLNNKQ